MDMRYPFPSVLEGADSWISELLRYLSSGRDKRPRSNFPNILVWHPSWVVKVYDFTSRKNHKSHEVAFPALWVLLSGYLFKRTCCTGSKQKPQSNTTQTSSNQLPPFPCSFLTILSRTDHPSHPLRCWVLHDASSQSGIWLRGWPLLSMKNDNESVTRVYVPRFFVSSQQRFGVADIKALGASQLSGLGQTVLQLLGKSVLQLHFI